MINDYNADEMSPCPVCGHLVPSLNLAIHQATACGRVIRSVAVEPNHRGPNREDDRTSSAVVSSQGYQSPETGSMNPPLHPPSPRQSIIILDHSDDEVEIDEVDTQHQHQHPPTSSTAEKQWTCPRCTLFNPLHSKRCDACDYAYSEPTSSTDPHSTLTEARNSHTRPPDPIQQRQQLVQMQPSSYSTVIHPDGNNNSLVDSSNTMRFMGGGALIGSLLGAAGAMMRGRNFTHGIMEGAMTGALGGVVARDVLTAASIPPRAAARVSSQQGGLIQHNNESVHPNTRVVAITRRRFPDGTVQTICEENGVRVVRQRQATNGSNEEQHPINPFMMAQTPFLRAMSMSSEQNRGINRLPPTLIMPTDPFRVFTTASGGVSPDHPLDAMDGMDYERLLEIFGDGSDHRRGADEATIRRLPTTTLKNVDSELPKDREYRLCSICLEEFSNGQTRKVLPCLHGFHDTCIDRWLLADACCPICKHSLQ